MGGWVRGLWTLIRLSLLIGGNADHPLANPLGPSSPNLAEVALDPILVVVGGDEILRDRGGILYRIQSSRSFVRLKFIFLSMISLVYLTGVLGNIMSGLLYLSPTPTFWRIVKRRSTEEFESIPYICKLLNAYFWIYYGVIKPNSLLVATVNMFGAIVEIIFLTIFLLLAPSRMKARTAILVAILDVGFPAAAVLVTQFLLHAEMRIDVAGLLCIAFSMIAYASPLSAMKTVVTTKSVEYMPFLLSFIFFVNGGVWTAYAFLANDLFVGIPNGTGFFLGTAQLILYAMYWKPKPSRQVSDNLDDQQQHEPLIPGGIRSLEESTNGTFWRIVKHRSTEEFESFPYICTLLNSALWTYYGVTKSGGLLVATVNGFGVIVEIVYVILFLVFAPPRMRKTVVTAKSVEYMPFLLSFFMFLNGGIWTFYAILVKDFFLGVPNGIGFLLGAAQLVLYAIYRNPKSSRKISEDLEDQSQHQHLLPSSTPSG
ncbi:hypothetical protein FH972_006643 [Carpinus fangiana]|uniref:Bidirectional sugar transporter SWEET n=1 Tax=Carpinus fangiana TaxID=176857 RepID=A0A5N6QUT4_9ROSI|nr:hypothetical protein FH972_006643 [Carpinus fangiana]